MFIGTRTRATKLGTDSWRGTPDDATILQFAEEALERPSDSVWYDDRLWNTHTFMFASAPDSNDLVSQSNYRTLLRDLHAAYPRQITASGFGHWTYSHYDALLVQVVYSNGEITPGFAEAVEIALYLRDEYPLWDDNDHSELEMWIWTTAITDAVEWELSGENDKDTILDDVTNWLWESEELVGYHEVGYVPDELVTKAIETIRAEFAAAQSVGMVTPNNSGSPLI